MNIAPGMPGATWCSRWGWTNRRGLRARRGEFADVDLAALELDGAVLEREDRVVAAEADVEAGLELGAALADDDRAGADRLAAVRLDAAVLGVAVAAVLRRALTLFMCHVLPQRAKRFWILDLRFWIERQNRFIHTNERPAGIGGAGRLADCGAVRKSSGLRPFQSKIRNPKSKIPYRITHDSGFSFTSSSPGCTSSPRMK